MKRTASMSDIARRAGTSIAAVSVTLNGAKSSTLRVSDETRLRIQQAAQELKYRRNHAASALATGRTNVIGVMLPEQGSYASQDPYYSLTIAGIMACASEHGYNVMLYTATSEAEGLEAAAMVDKRVDGLILVSPPQASPIYDECHRQGLPCVSILGWPNEAPFSIQSDDYMGGLLATRHLISLGHRRIGHLKGLDSIATTEPRLRGYRDAFAEAGIAYSDEYCLNGNFGRGFSYECTKEWMRMPAETRPTAIFAANDKSAHGAIEAIQDAGMRVPEDVAVVGYDDTWYATVLRPALTSVRMDVPTLGLRAAETLIDFLKNGGSGLDRQIIVPVSLTVRESSGANLPDSTARPYPFSGENYAT